MFQATITLTASTDLLNVLQTIAQALGVKPNIQQVSTKKNKELKAELITPTTTTATPINTALTAEAIRAITQAKIEAGKKEAVKQILTTIGFRKLSDLPEDKFQEFHDSIINL